MVVDEQPRPGEGTHAPVEHGNRSARKRRLAPERRLSAPEQDGCIRRLAARPERERPRREPVRVRVRHDPVDRE
jgi:hypothetical protein